ncbi:MAG TPA: hypothetical protein VFI40_12140, partial [Nocardioides sp.]|nr:hypothetical protein [Nocardioides sp.]
FSIDPKSAWAAVPLESEYVDDAFTASPLDEAVVDRLMTASRLAFAERVHLKGRGGDQHPLRELAYETPDLTDILTDEDISDLAETADVITSFNRSDPDPRVVVA